MTETVGTGQTEIKLANGKQLSDTVQNMFDQAIAFCARQMDVADPGTVVGLLLADNRTASEYCFYSLARQTAEFLGSVDSQINAAYVVDYDALCEGEDSPSLYQGVPVLHLILRTERKTAALDSLIAALDRALTHHYAHLFDRPQVQHLLDVQVVDEADIAHQTWPGTLLNTLYHRPVQLWQR